MSVIAVASPSPTIAATPRLIDPRGHRFGAALSAVILVGAFALQAPIVVAAIGVALGVSALFGTQYSALGRPWPFVRRALRLGPPAELEGEYPPRFAQALGTIGLSLAAVLFAAGAGTLAWLVVAAVGGLQTVLAATGYCLGCRLYFLRWYVPSLFDRLVAAVPRLAR
jgi:hypothetical protein